MPFPGTLGSVWKPDTWAADTWTDDSWAGATTPTPPTPSTGGGGGVGRVSAKDVLAIERMLRHTGRLKAVQHAEARGRGTVKNLDLRTPPKLRTLEPRKPYDPIALPDEVPEPEPPPPPEPISGAADALVGASCQAIGYVTMGDKDEMMGMMVGLNDDALWRMIWEK